jgi:hypothetical protein
LDLDADLLVVAHVATVFTLTRTLPRRWVRTALTSSHLTHPRRPLPEEADAVPVSREPLARTASERSLWRRRIDQPRLADPGLALQDGQPAAPPHGPDDLFEQSKLRVTTNQRWRTNGRGEQSESSAGETYPGSAKPQSESASPRSKKSATLADVFPAEGGQSLPREPAPAPVTRNLDPWVDSRRRSDDRRAQEGTEPLLGKQATLHVDPKRLVAPDHHGSEPRAAETH